MLRLSWNRRLLRNMWWKKDINAIVKVAIEYMYGVLSEETMTCVKYTHNHDHHSYYLLNGPFWVS